MEREGEREGEMAAEEGGEAIQRNEITHPGQKTLQVKQTRAEIRRRGEAGVMMEGLLQREGSGRRAARRERDGGVDGVWA